MTNPTHALTRPNWYPYIILAIGALAGATGPIFLRLAQAEGVPTPIITTFRFLIASLVFTPFVIQNHTDELRQLTRRDLLLTIAAGVIFSLQLTANFESFRHVSILISGVLMGSMPLWTALIERFAQKVHFDRAVWAGLALALAGGLLIGINGKSVTISITENLPLGSALALSGALLGALYLIMGRSVRQSITFVPFVWLVFSSATVTALITALIGGFRLTGYSAEGYFWVLMATLLTQLVGHSAFNYALAYIPATLIGMVGPTITVLSAIAAFLIFQELPAPLQIVGSAIITVGVVLAVIGQTHRKG